MDGRAPVAVVTGVSREAGIGVAVARRLAADGWRVATVGWRPYDERMSWGADAGAPDADADWSGEVDLADADATDALIGTIADQLAPPSALVLCHCESVDSGIRDTTVEAFDRHMAVNARATWQLVRAFAAHFPGPPGTGRIVSITSDHTAGNLPYGASKGAMDRIVLAAAVELAELGVTANVVNPGATDTGWMDEEIRAAVIRRNLQPRLGTPTDVANIASFLCSHEGGWINGQLLHADGGRRP